MKLSFTFANLNKAFIQNAESQSGVFFIVFAILLWSHFSVLTALFYGLTSAVGVGVIETLFKIAWQDAKRQFSTNGNPDPSTLSTISDQGTPVDSSWPPSPKI